MRKKLSLLLGSSLIISNCTIPTSVIKESPTLTTTNKLNIVGTNKVEIKVLNPSSSERNMVDW